MSKIFNSLLIIVALFVFSCGNGYQLSPFQKALEPTPIVEIPEPTPPDPQPLVGGGGTGTFNGERPLAPTNLEVTSVGSNSVDLQWTASDMADTYKLYKKTGVAGTYSLIDGNISGSLTTYKNSLLAQDTTYYYKLLSSNSTGDSIDFSNEVFATTSHCSNDTGPTITLNTANPASNYPSVSATNFSKSNSVAVRYSLADLDGCDSSFTVTVQIKRPGDTTPITVFSGSDNTGSKSKSWPVPLNTLNPQGIYDLTVTATDGAHPAVQQTQASYFQILALPADSTSPTVTSASVSKSPVCPGENYTLSFTLADDSIGTSPKLPSTWLHSYIYQIGDANSKANAYNTSISYPTSYPIQSSPVPSNTVRQYYADAYDYTGKNVTNASSTNLVNVAITSDTQVPQNVSFTSLPSGSQLQMNESYSVTATATDNCPGLRYEFSFVWGPNPADRKTLGTSYSTSATATFTLDGQTPPVGTVGWFEVKAKDTSGNITTFTSASQYTIVVSHRPSVLLTTDAYPASHPTYFDINYATNIQVQIKDNDAANALIQYLTYSSPSIDILPKNSAYTGNGSDVPENVPWTTPSTGGTYTIQVSIVDSENYTATKSLTVNVGQSPTLAITTNPTSPFTTEQQISILLNVNDNSPAGMKLNYVRYTQDNVHYNPVIDTHGTVYSSQMNFAGHESITWVTPIFPGSYTLSAEILDNEGWTKTATLPIQVNASSTSRSIVYLDYDLSGIIPFNKYVKFDINADSTLEWVKWINQYDGYLVKSSTVNNVNDFSFLNEMQSSAGNVLDSSDSAFSTVKIWIDANSNGVSEPGEVRSLGDAGIVSITLNPCCSFSRW